MQCPSCAAPASEGQSHCARCHAPLSALAGAYAATTSSTEKTIMFDQAPWPPAEEQNTGSWTPAAPPVVPPPGGPAPEPSAPLPFAEVPPQAAPAPGEATEWWTPAMDGPSGATPLPPQQAWSPQPAPAPPAVPEAPSVPVVPDSWFAEPRSERSPAEAQGVQTGPFTPVFEPEPPRHVPSAGFAPDSTFSGMSVPGVPSGPNEFTSSYPQPNEPAPEPFPAQAAAPTPDPTYAAAPEAPYAQPGGLASEPPYGQPGGFTPESPYGQPAPPAYGQPQAFAPSPGMMGAGGGLEQPAWMGVREDKPLWDPDGPMPMTRSHRSPSPDGGGRNKPLLIGVASLVVIALIAVSFVLLNGGDDGKETVRPVRSAAAQPKNKPVDPAVLKQAKKVHLLLNASAKSRVALSDALVKAQKCANIPASVATMQQVARQRQAQLKRVQSLNVPRLPNAVKLRTALARSIKLSLDVDLAYLAWARSNQGCKGKTPTKGANYKRGTALSSQATQAKSRFLGMWNQLAPEYGLAKRQSF